ncbi:MAG TPA: T9SS type A sorting domain-containing protein, partial [Bacteroidia bacterium]
CMKQTQAQYTKLLDFADTTNGSQPFGSLMQASDGMLYGITYGGGANAMGVLFQYNPATNIYTKKLDFSGVTNGSNPRGSLMQASDGMLYGMTTYGGASTNCSGGCGVLFQYNPTTNTYTKKLDFAGTTNGSNPAGSLMQASDGMLYGMTHAGGASNLGVLFQYNPTANTYTKKLDFAGTTNGSKTQGSLMQASDGMLYAMTYSGGVSDYGVIFQYNPTTNTYTKKLDFAGVTNGSYPLGSLMQASDGMLYGMTYEGGVYNWGVLFQYNPTTNTCTKELDLAGGINGNPAGDLMQASDGMMYGMAYIGGASGYGVLFQYNPTTSTYTKELDFSGTTNGSFPTGSLMQASDGMLYGMTEQGGASTNCSGSGCGTLFKYGIGAAGIQQVTGINEQVNIYPNPSNGSFIIEANNTKQAMQVYDVNGKLVLSQLINGKATIDATPLNEGVYTISLISNEGVVNKKLVIIR